MLLRPLAAMNGCDGTAGARTRLGWAGAPMKAGGLVASGPSGMGWAGTAAPAGEAAMITHVTIAASAATGAVRSLSSRSPLEMCLTSPPQAWFGDGIYRPGAILASLEGVGTRGSKRAAMTDPRMDDRAWVEAMDAYARRARRHR